MNYYQKNREKMSKKAYEKYLNGGRKKKNKLKKRKRKV